MLPHSQEIEVFHSRAQLLLRSLKKLKSAEVTKTELKIEIAAIAREWLRFSPSLRASGVCGVDRLDLYDQNMKEALASTTGRARASALHSKISPLVDNAFNDIVVPLIKFEGSPRQVAARQIQSAFGSPLTPDETVYIEEAAHCVTVPCYRAALIMLWAAAVARLHDAVVKRGFDAYNRAVDATTSKKGAPFNRVKEGAKISSLPELQRSRDADILVIGMELFGYDLQVFQELDRLLGSRNDAAHPGMAKLIAMDVQQFATKVASLIFDKIPV